jgi:hypothetical protein
MMIIRLRLAHALPGGVAQPNPHLRSRGQPFAVTNVERSICACQKVITEPDFCVDWLTATA